MPGEHQASSNCFDPSLLLEKIFSPCQLDIAKLCPELEEHKTRLTDLVTRCIHYGESNSVLVVGPRGCGKTTLIRSCLQELELPTSKAAFVVKLSGLLQTDDNIALEEITRQLELENVTDGMVFGSFEEKLQFLLQSLKSGSKSSRPVVFVINEFDLFTYHRNQTLLYNLFDICQSKHTPLCIIGETCRLDAMELLEKRVKSRFSHRFIHMLVKPSFKNMVNLMSDYLKLSPTTNQVTKSHCTEWNKKIDLLFKDSMIKDALLFRFNITTDLHAVKNLAALIVANWSCKPEHYLPEREDIIGALSLMDVDSKASILKGVSVLDLCLIIAMKQLNELYCDEPFTFQMVYEHYKKFSQRLSFMKAVPKAIALKAFEHLLDLEIIKPVQYTSKGLKHYRPVLLQVTSQEIDDAVQLYVGCPSDVKRWALNNWVH